MYPAYDNAHGPPPGPTPMIGLGGTEVCLSPGLPGRPPRGVHAAVHSLALVHSLGPPVHTGR